MYFEQEWREGVRHGIYRRRNEVTGDLIIELNFDRGRLHGVGNSTLQDFMLGSTFKGIAGRRARAALEAPISVQYADATLAGVIRDLCARCDVPVFIDERALAKVGIATDVPITASVREVPVFAAMEVAFANSLELSVHYRHEVLWVTSRFSDALNERRVKLEKGSSLEATLHQDVSLEYRKAELGSVLDDISRRHQVDFINRVNSTPQVTLFTPNVSLRSALWILLHKLDLYCEADGDALVIRDAPP